ncbi:PTS sugar transporter subunit IIA [Lactobacillus xylocopicola]|uniref:PTS fructose transporter subunit IIA n=1 Tax=Lactobacillus xylocopicola TaxID=2976676 RepID=A0ABM8BI50_9LACO|nr:hypothetical protein [Lactobacillus xylocopicola]BDR60967.1 PTS fructose transporter subunit IIA [Lactobacillus xylocopicola]
MFKIVIASHGSVAEAMKKSVKLFFPDEEDIITAKIDEEGLVPFQNKLDQIVQIIENQSVLFLVDVPYGTPFNEIVKRMVAVKKDSDILAGVNMPTLIEAINLRNQNISLMEAIPKLIEVSQLQSYSEKLKAINKSEDDE